MPRLTIGILHPRSSPSNSHRTPRNIIIREANSLTESTHHSPHTRGRTTIGSVLIDSGNRRTRLRTPRAQPGTAPRIVMVLPGIIRHRIELTVRDHLVRMLSGQRNHNSKPSTRSLRTHATVSLIMSSTILRVRSLRRRRICWVHRISMQPPRLPSSPSKSSSRTSKENLPPINISPHHARSRKPQMRIHCRRPPRPKRAHRSRIPLMGLLRSGSGCDTVIHPHQRHATIAEVFFLLHEIPRRHIHGIVCITTRWLGTQNQHIRNLKILTPSTNPSLLNRGIQRSVRNREFHSGTSVTKRLSYRINPGSIIIIIQNPVFSS